jgi:hypothetical protein
MRPLARPAAVLTGRARVSPRARVPLSARVLPSARVLLSAGATLVVGLTLAGCTTLAPGPPGGSAAPPAAATAAAGQLDTLTVAPAKPMTGYSRDRFPLWRKVDKYCDTRDTVLMRDGSNVKASKTCKITSGTWLSPYDQKTVRDPQQIDIDHMVPLANAWRSGADGWTDEKRSDFANDLTRPQLAAVSATTNRSKGDQDPSTWKPPNTAFWCEYAERWIAVKAYWKLTLTDREKSALREMLGTCQASNSSTAPISSPARAG